MEINVQGTGNVMDACRRLGVRKVVYASTAQVYGIPRWLPISEDHPAAPRSVYGTSKLAGERMAAGAVIARLSNLYGGSVGPRTVLGRAIDCVRSGRPIQLRSMEEVRDFLYIEDAAEALVRLADVGEGVTVNVSTGTGVRIADAVRELVCAAQQQGRQRAEVLPPAGEPDREVPEFVLDNHRLRELTGWAPATPMRQAFLKTLGGGHA